jgi:hypothetical protein
VQANYRAAQKQAHELRRRLDAVRGKAAARKAEIARLGAIASGQVLEDVRETVRRLSGELSGMRESVAAACGAEEWAAARNEIARSEAREGEGQSD